MARLRRFRFEFLPISRKGSRVQVRVEGAPRPHRGSRSKDDVLLEEIRNLRQLLSESNEENRIQVANIRDEVSELRQQAAVTEGSLSAVRQRLDEVVGISNAANRHLEAELQDSNAQECLLRLLHPGAPEPNEAP
ncbi:unnamed protein product [Symbiodinium natans]|uniref:Uncharacterized protein n=1 Tax=Symbiodinium natans TaxID=878477 RepID=A0A812PU35_9DINO|nr:unnamed protein product [Symbiodinium natans]